MYEIDTGVLVSDSVRKLRVRDGGWYLCFCAVTNITMFGKNIYDLKGGLSFSRDTTAHNCQVTREFYFVLTYLF